MAVGQNQWCHFGVGEFTTHFRTYFSVDWDVHWGYGILTHGHIIQPLASMISTVYADEHDASSTLLPCLKPDIQWRETTQALDRKYHLLLWGGQYPLIATGDIPMPAP